MISDQAQRQLALTPSKSFLIQAPAGSGKTELLIQRYLQLLTCVNNPEEIIAITFTNKAASEMRERVLRALANTNTPLTETHQQLTQKLAQNVLANDEKHHWQLRENPARLRIMTIDSLCARLTYQMPILARVGHQPTISHDPHVLYQRAVRNLLMQLEENSPWQDALFQLYNHLDNNVNSLERLLISMLKNRDQWLTQILQASTQTQLRQQLEQALTHLINEHLKNLSACFPKAYISEFMATVHFALSHLPEDHALQLLNECVKKNQLPHPSVEHLKHWQAIAEFFLTKTGEFRKQVTKNNGFPSAMDFPKNEREFIKAMKQRFLELIENLSTESSLQKLLQECQRLPLPKYNEPQWQIVEALLKILKILVAELRLVFMETGQVDFSEISQSALYALGEYDNPSDLALALDHKIQHILVDEFQDTSVSQFHLLERLTAGWEMNDERTLFLVGDPMQSIYRFRQAEVGLFLRAKHHGVGNVKLEYLVLTQNFRATAELVKWNNKTYQKLFPAEENISRGAVTFSLSQTHQQDNQSQVEIHACFKDEEDKYFHHPLEKIIAIIQERLHFAPKESIAILVRSRNHVFELLPALREAGIPYRAVDIETLGDSALIHDLMALTRALLHPADRLSQLAILRAPWCGLTLTDLHIIANHDNKLTIWQTLNHSTVLKKLSPSSQKILQRVIPVLEKFYTHRYRRSLAEIVRSAWLALGGPATLIDENMLNDAKTFFDLLQTIELHHPITDFAYIEQQIDTLFATPLVTSEVNVQIMTIHKAKGLEFDTVILPMLEAKPRADNLPLLIWLEQANDELLFAPIRASDQLADPIYDFLFYFEQQKKSYELTRLLYVATTRARRYLHLIGSVSIRDDKIQLPAKNSLLHLLWQSLNTEFENVFLTAKKQTAKIMENEYEIDETIFYRLKEEWEPPTYSHPTPPPTSLGEGKFNISATTEGEDIEINLSQIEQQNIDTSSLQTTNNKTLDQKDTFIERQRGILIHRLLLQIASGKLIITPQIIENAHLHWKNWLTFHQFNDKEIAETFVLLDKLFLHLQTDPRAQWILDKNHTEIYNEYALTFRENSFTPTLSPLSESEKIKRIVIDRTFISQGVRWIIDYKTATPKSMTIEKFLAEEKKLYQLQLNTYAEALQLQTKYPIRCGLYFPLVPVWCEWEFTST